MVSSTTKKTDRSQWRAFAGNVFDNERADYGDQFGISFSGQHAIDQDSWLSSVQDLRQSSGTENFFDWLLRQPEIDWELFLSSLNTTAVGISLGNMVYCC